MLCLLLVLPILGCSNEEDPAAMEDPVAGYTVYERPTFTPGTLESDLLTVQTGNFDRASRTSNGYFLELGTGYLYLFAYWYYADFNNLTNWVIYCNEPDCAHTTAIACPSGVGQMYLHEDGRLYFLANNEYSYLAPGYKNGNYLLVSTDIARSDEKLVHVWPEANFGSNGRMSASRYGYSGYIMDFQYLNTDGSTYAKFFIVDKELGQVELTEGGSPLYVRNECSIFGDTAYIRPPFSDRLYMWIKDGELVEATLPELPLMGGHWSGSTVRFYRTNDGYYDYDLLTGEETRIADAQVDDAAAWIIEPNCILETTLFESSDADKRAAVRTHTMKLFDGQTWHDVTLPDDIARGRTDVEFLALTSDSIILTHKVKATKTEPGSTTFYRIALGQETYTLEQIGRFTAE